MLVCFDLHEFYHLNRLVRRDTTGEGVVPVYLVPLDTTAIVVGLLHVHLVLPVITALVSYSIDVAFLSQT